MHFSGPYCFVKAVDGSNVFPVGQCIDTVAGNMIGGEVVGIDSCPLREELG